MRISRAVCVLALLIVWQPVWAASQTYYSIQAVVSVDGHEVMHPSAIALADNPVTVTDAGPQRQFRLQYTVTPGEDALTAIVHISFFDRSPSGWTLRSQPSMGVRLGQQASIVAPYEVGGIADSHVTISVQVTKKSEQELLAMFHGDIPDPSICPAATQKLQIGRVITYDPPTPGKGACCSKPCSDGSGDTMTCCGAITCRVCGACCSPH